MAKPEGIIEDYLRQQAELHGYLCMKFVSPGNNGVPDRILIGYGETFFVETKAPGEKTRALQDCVIADIRAHGAKVYILDTKDKIDRLFTEKRKTFQIPIQQIKKNQTEKKHRLCRKTARVVTSVPATSGS